MTNLPSQSDRPAESRPGPSSTPSDDTAHRDALRILLDRACRGALLVDEAELLRQHVETELRAGDKARAERDRLAALYAEADRLREHAGCLYLMFRDLREEEADRADRAEADNEQLRQRLDRIITHRDTLEAAIARVRALREHARTEEPMAQGPTWKGLDEALDGPQAPVDAPHHGGPIGWQDPNA